MGFSQLNSSKYVLGISSICFTLLSIYSTSASAEYFGLPSGRTANISAHPDLSFEGSLTTGDADGYDFQNLGGRFNFKVAPEISAFIDVAQTEIDRHDGVTLGGGIFYQINGLSEDFDLAAKGTYHSGEVERSGYFDVEVSGISLEALISGANVGDTNLNWFANAGVHVLKRDSVDDTEFGIGGGAVLPLSIGEAYFAVDVIDELTFGGGVRYFF